MALVNVLLYATGCCVGLIIELCVFVPRKPRYDIGLALTLMLKYMAPHGRLCVVTSFALTSASTVVVALRFYTRQFLVGKLAASDWVMLLALIANWSSAMFNWYTIRTIDEKLIHLHNPETLHVLLGRELMCHWVNRLNYVVNLCLIKTSILLFYDDISALNKRFLYSIRALLAINISGGVAFSLASIFVCYPIADAWMLPVPTKGIISKPSRYCYDPASAWIVNAGYNLVTDVIIWSLPMVLFLNLRKMPLDRRLGIIATFSVGIVAIAASAVRIRFVLLWFSGLKQRDLNTANLLVWNQVEQHAGLIAGSVPFLRPLIRQAMERAGCREQSSLTPAEHLVEEGTLTPNVAPSVFRRPIIPSTSSDGSSHHDFRRPEWDLEEIEPVQSYTHGWESAHPPWPQAHVKNSSTQAL